MYLDLKPIREYLQVNLRSVIRSARKRELGLHIVIRGYQEQSVTLTINKTGPIVEATNAEILYYGHQNNKWVLLRRDIDFEKEINSDEVLHDLVEKLEHHGISYRESDEDTLKVISNEHSVFDEKLIQVDIKELIVFFRSRFLIDGPKKMLYNTQLTRGFHFYGYSYERSDIELNGATYYDVNVSMRSKSIGFQYRNRGCSLREMRLYPTRTSISPYWQAEIMDSVESPEQVVFGVLALSKLAEFCLSQIDAGNKSLWNWLEPLSSSEDWPLPELKISEEKNLSELSSLIANHFKLWHQPPGELEDSLQDLLLGKTNSIERAIYIHDITAIDVDKNQVYLSSYGTSLLLEKGAKPEISNDIYNVNFEGEIFNPKSQQSSRRICLMQMGDSRNKVVYVPEYSIIDGLNIQIHHI